MMRSEYEPWAYVTFLVSLGEVFPKPVELSEMGAYEVFVEI